MAKLTKKDHFNTLLTIAEVQKNPELVKFINHELELLDRKNSKDRKATPTQKANEGYKELILDFLADGEPHSITDMIKGIEAFEDFSNQKVSALVKALKDGGQVERVEIKRKAYFQLV